MTTEPEVTLPDALAWLESHSGKYSVVILGYISGLEFINKGLRDQNVKLHGLTDSMNESWVNRIDSLCNELSVKMPDGMTREERHQWAKDAQKNANI